MSFVNAEVWAVVRRVIQKYGVEASSRPHSELNHGSVFRERWFIVRERSEAVVLGIP